MEELTKRQNEILTYIKKFIVSNGYPPTVREIGEALDVSSPATIHAHLQNLEEKGWIKKQGSKNRAIELLVENEFEPKNENVVAFHSFLYFHIYFLYIELHFECDS